MLSSEMTKRGHVHFCLVFCNPPSLRHLSVGLSFFFSTAANTLTLSLSFP